MNATELITPLILTYNEAPNIGRTLEHLRWARQIVVIDSNSTDETEQIVARFPQVRFIKRSFDNHPNQWNFGIEQISTPWVLALDADFLVTKEFLQELNHLPLHDGPDGYSSRLLYNIYGRRLRSSTSPYLTVLFRRDKGRYRHDGHTQRLHLDKEPKRLRSALVHDDRKSLSRWLQSQDRYMILEVKKLLQTPNSDLNFADRIRKTKVWAPLAMGIYCLIVKRAILDGWPGWFYTGQRVLAEILFTLRLIEAEMLEAPAKQANPAKKAANSSEQTQPSS